MKLEWMGAYREIIGDFYRSANGYSQICKNEMFGDPIKFSPYEVQIMEHIMEHADQHRNMKWYANRLGLSQATYSKYVRKLVDKGLLEKYHTSGNKKDVILMVSPQASQREPSCPFRWLGQFRHRPSWGPSMLYRSNLPRRNPLRPVFSLGLLRHPS